MKRLTILTLVAFSAQTHTWAADCRNSNSAVQIALDATKGLLNLAEVPPVEEFRGGVLENDIDKTLITIEAHYRFTKDWYNIIVRNDDCRVLAAELRGEGLQPDATPNTVLHPLQ